jgi:hypothetical protein
MWWFIALSAVIIVLAILITFDKPRKRPEHWNATGGLLSKLRVMAMREWACKSLSPDWQGAYTDRKAQFVCSTQSMA